MNSEYENDPEFRHALDWAGHSLGEGWAARRCHTAPHPGNAA
jgi:hypothetical protein